MASNPLMDALKILNSASSKKTDGMSKDTAKNLLGNILEYTEKLQEEINENAPDDKKEKYNSSLSSLNSIIAQGMSDSDEEIDTTGVQDVLDEAKDIRGKKKHMSKAEKELYKIVDEADEQEKE